MAHARGMHAHEQATIGRLDVAMDRRRLEAVQVCERLRRANSQLQPLWPGESGLGLVVEASPDAAVLTEFIHESTTRPIGAVADKRAQVLMLELIDGAELVYELLLDEALHRFVLHIFVDLDGHLSTVHHASVHCGECSFAEHLGIVVRNDGKLNSGYLVHAVLFRLLPHQRDSCIHALSITTHRVHLEATLMIILEEGLLQVFLCLV